MSRLKPRKSRKRVGAAAPNYLFDGQGAPLANIIYSPRRERGAYVGSWALVERGSNHERTNINFLSNGEIDEQALYDWCGTSEGRIAVLYDQGTASINFVEDTWAEMPRVFGQNESGQWVPEKINGRIAMVAPNSTLPSGLTTPVFTAQTGNAVTAVIVGRLTSTSTSFSPRYISLLPSNTSLTDVDQTGAYLISRNGGTTPTEQWAIQRGGAVRATRAGAYNQLQQVTAQVNGSVYSLSVDGATTTGSHTLPNFNYSRIAFGNKGDGNMTSTGMALSSCYFYFSAPAAVGLKVVQDSLQDYFGTAEQTGTAPPGRTNLPSFTLVFDEDFNTDCPEGQFLNVYGNKFHAYNQFGLTTQGKEAGTGDHYATSNMSVSNGSLVMRLFRGPDGKAWACAPIPKFPNYTKWPWNGQLYGRYEYRMKVTNTAGWKMAPLLWPDDEDWPENGEIDLPDQSFTSNFIRMFMHRQNATQEGDQDEMRIVPSKNMRDDFRTIAMEWKPNSLRCFVDGVAMEKWVNGAGNGQTTLTSRVPNTSMHFIFQIENNIGGTQPAAGVEAFCWLDYFAAWAYTP